MTKKQKNTLARIIIAASCLVTLAILDAVIPFWWLKLIFYMVPYLIVGHDILRKAFKGIFHGQVTDENFLMTVATLAAIGVGIYNAFNGGDDDYLEAVAVMLLYQVGELFQSYAIGKSRKNIASLMDIRPDYANIEKDGELVRVDPYEVEIGSIIVVNPGEKIPLDGVVVEGTSAVNTAALTGESIPRDVTVGSNILSGCVNVNGVIKVKTTTEFDESTAAKILDLVENAASRKSKSENFISKFSRVYTPIVCIAALVLAVAPSLIILAVTGEADFVTWIYRAATFLVMSCPCAVVISIPLTFFAGLGGASREGVLVKGSNYLEALSHTKIVAFDKTGTITKGNFEVTGIYENTLPDDELLYLVAHIESSSSHPISESLRRAYGKEIDRSRVTDINEIGGEGVAGKVDGRPVAAGNSKLMKTLGIGFSETDKVGTIIHVSVDEKYAGYILIRDEMKENAPEAITALRDIGIRQTVMLTGDSLSVAEAVAKESGVDSFFAELLPGDKVDRVEELLLQKSDKEKLAVVGDGINDAPVLSRADIGIAMGAMGSDAAIEAADVVLMDDDPQKIAKAIKISRKCLGIVKVNITFSLAVKLVCLTLGAFGFANMWVAIIADVGVMIIAVLNAIRALFVKNL